MKLNIKSIRTKIIIASIAPLIPLFLLVLFNYDWMRNQKTEWLNEHYRDILLHESYKLVQFKELTVSNVHFLTRIPPVVGLIRAHDNGGIDPRDGSSEKELKERMEQLFISMIETPHFFYDSIRFIDKTGMEIVRVNLKNGSGSAAPEEELQNKHDRYYFKEIALLHKGEVYLSSIDLNQKNGKIGIPYKPMLRAASPVFSESGDFEGIIVINILMEPIIKNAFEHASEHDHGTNRFHFISDETGAYLHLEINPQKEWGGPNDLNTSEGLKKDYPNHYLQIMSGEVVLIDHQDDKRVIYSKKIPLWPSTDKFLIIGESISLNIAMQKINSFSLILFGLLFLSFFASVAIAVYGGRKATASVITFFNVVKRFKNGDWTTRAVHIADDEIGHIAKVFNELADDVMRQKDESQVKLNLLSKAIEQSPLSVVITDPKGNIEYVNPYFLKITGYSIQEVMGQNPRVLKSGHQPPEIYKQLWDTINSGSVWQGELLNKTKNGQLYWESVTISPVLDNNGKICNIVAIKENITERKKAESILQKNKIRFESLYKLSNETGDIKQLCEYALEEAIKLTDSKVGYFHFFNQKEIKKGLFIWFKDSAEKCKVSYDLEYPLELAGIWADSLIQKKAVIHNDYQILTSLKEYPEGHFEVIRHMSIPVRFNDEVVAICGVGNKIEPYDENDTIQLQLYMDALWSLIQRKIAEQSLRESMQTLKSFLNAIPESAFLIDLSGKILATNHLTAMRLYKTVDELIGTDVFSFLPADVAAQRRKRIDEVINTCAPVSFEDTRNGKHFDHRINPIFDETGKVIKLAILGIDISKRKRIEEELVKAKEAAEAANRAKSLFIANMGHELKTPLNAIIGFSQILQAQSFGPLNSKQSQYITNIVISGDILLSLINNVLEVSRLETGKIKINPVVFSIRELIDRTVRPIVFKNNIVFDVQIDPSIPCMILGDEYRIGQVLNNLTDNAVKFTKTGNITLSVKQNTPDELLFEVRDTGIGISKEAQSGLFERFHQVDGSFTKKYSGAGLGLVICKQMVELMGGKIWVISEVDKGSSFYFTIKFMPAGAESGVLCVKDMSSIEAVNAIQNRPDECISALPQDMVLQMQDALSRADLDSLVQLIDEIDSNYAELANHLKELVQNYDYNALQQIFKNKE
ncbi:MAG: PAS domain S-box protein [Desulfamplus sp.]|nr:PAS domain S-box protein [Desulfamplus sp.]